MNCLFSESVQLTQLKTLRREVEQQSGNVNYVDKRRGFRKTLAGVRALCLGGNHFDTLDGVEFCTNLRILEVCLFAVARARAR